MHRNGLDAARSLRRSLDRPLQRLFMRMVPADHPALRVARLASRGENPVPAPGHSGPRILALQGMRQIHPGTFGEPICIVQRPHADQMGAQGAAQAGRQNRHPVLAALAVTHHEFAPLKIDVLDAQAQALHEPQPGAIDQARHQGTRPLHYREQAFDFMHAQHRGQARRALGAHHVIKPREFGTQHLPIEKQQG